MRPAENIEKLIKNIDVDTNAKTDKAVLDDVLKTLEESKKLALSKLVPSRVEGAEGTKSASLQPNIWRIIMKKPITKLAVAVVIIIAMLISINYFGGSIAGASVVFADVLEYFQTYSYTFDLTIEPTIEGSPTFDIKAMVLELGRLRIDCSAPVGKISSVTDFNTGKSLLLFHQNKAGVIMEEPVLKMNAGIGGIYPLFSKPIENLWNLCDGTEENLGEKEIAGQITYGFKVFQEDQYFQYDIAIWADVRTGAPILVEVLSKPLHTSYPSGKWTMKNFDLDVELDEKLFSLEVPAGYTSAYPLDLDELEVETEPSPEAEKIEQMLELWSEGRKNQALEILLGINWTKPIEFGNKPYIFSITERGYISLKAEDQNRIMEEVMATATTVRNIVYEVLDLGQAAMAAKEYEEAGRYFESGLQLGKLLKRDPHSMIMVRLLGIAVEKKTLNEMISLYTAMNDQEKLQVTERQLRAVETEGEKIKNKVRRQ